MINTNELRHTGDIAKAKSLSDSGQITAGKMLRRAADTIDQQAALIAELTDKIGTFTSSVPAVNLVDGLLNKTQTQAALIEKYEEALTKIRDFDVNEFKDDPAIHDNSPLFVALKQKEIAEKVLAGLPYIDPREKEDTTP